MNHSQLGNSTKLFIRDGLLTDLEATIGTYEFHSYGGDYCGVRLGTYYTVRNHLKLAVFRVDI